MAELLMVVLRVSRWGKTKDSQVAIRAVSISCVSVTDCNELFEGPLFLRAGQRSRFDRHIHAADSDCGLVVDK